MIPEEIYTRFGLRSLEDTLHDFGPTNDGELTAVVWYKTFLDNSDFVITKIAEGAATKAENVELIHWRAFARAEINRIKKQ